MEMVVLVLELVVPAVVILTTLFGLLARGDPKPGGVALFFRVGLAGLVIGFVLFYLEGRIGLTGIAASVFANGYRGLIAASGLLVLMGAFGAVLKRKQ